MLEKRSWKIGWVWSPVQVGVDLVKLGIIFFHQKQEKENGIG